MRLTFTQLSTLQRQDIYSAGGSSLSQATTWAFPHDDPVAQSEMRRGWETRRARENKTSKRERCLDSTGQFPWHIPVEMQGEDNKCRTSWSTIKRLAKLITQFHLSRSEDMLPWILPQTEELAWLRKYWQGVSNCLPEHWLHPLTCWRKCRKKKK